MASASLAQVHTANLIENNQEIVINILRPNISKKVDSNIKLLKLFAFFVKVLFKDRSRLKINQVVNDYERTILKEIDFFISFLKQFNGVKFNTWIQTVQK